MKNLLLFLGLTLSGAVNSQISLPAKAVITNPGSLYSTFGWSSGTEKDILATKVTPAEYDNIIKYSYETTWPAGISTFDERSKRQDDIKKYNVYIVAEVGMYDVLKIPAGENKHMPANMRATSDFYFVIGNTGVQKVASNSTKITGASDDDKMKYGILDTLVISFTIPKDLTGGANGAGIAYDPVRKLYYAAMAGNKNFGLIVYDTKGHVVSTSTTMIDVRGIWYNPVSKNIEVNGYNDNGMAHYIRNDKGIPTDIVIDRAGQNQPDENSCAALNTVDNTLLFLTLDEDQEYVIESHSKSTYENTSSMNFYSPDMEDLSESINYTSIVYTAIPKAEVGILDYHEKLVYLANLKNGYTTYVLSLSPDVVPEEKFNFAFANKLFWFFNKENRIWSAYKMHLFK